MVTWMIALDLIQDVRGSIAMYMFIIEEAIQTVGMSCYILYKDEKYAECLQLAHWILNNIIEPALGFAETYGHAAYPLEISYKVFYQASKKNMLTYIERCNAKMVE